MRYRVALSLVFALSALVLRADNPVQDSVQRAREHAQHASPKGQAKAYIEYVRALVDRAGELYAARQYDGSAKALDEANEALTKASASAEKYKHDVKDCDLILNKVERRLKDDAKSFSSQDRPRVHALIKQVQATRDRLLQILFETR